MEQNDDATKQNQRLLNYGALVLAWNLVLALAVCGIFITALLMGAPIRALILLSFIIAFGVSMFALACYYTNQLHRDLPNAYSYWQKYAIFFVAPLRMSAPDTEFGRALASKLMWFRINLAAAVSWFFLGAIIFLFTPIGLK